MEILDIQYCNCVTDFPCFIIQLSESEESEGEAENKTEKKAVHSGDRKYIPPKIAAVHYGNVICLFFFVFERIFHLQLSVSVELDCLE